MAVCTIVMSVYNQVDYTSRCLESVFAHTDVPYRMVIIDNGSRDGTPAFLAGLRPSAPRQEGLTVLTNPKTVCLAAAWNQGLRAAAHGLPVCLLNNDVVVTPGWLRAILGFLKEQPHVGIAGPHVTDGEIPGGYDAWASRYVAENRDRVEEGFHGCCFVLSPEVVQRVGLFDERFEVGVWEDVDYHHRARLAGFSPRVTHRAVVHHFGSKTIPHLVAELGGRNIYVENLQRYTEKWGIQLGNFTVSRSMLITW